MKIHYKGHKAKMPVYFPIGVQSRSAIEKTQWCDPWTDMKDEDAAALVKLDPRNFETEEQFKEKEAKRLAVEKVEEELKAKKSPGRPPAAKAQAPAAKPAPAPAPKAAPVVAPKKECELDE